VTQARATASVDGREVLTVNAALGTGELTSPTPWLTMPDVPEPGDCRTRQMPSRYDNSIFNYVETRIALGRSFEELDGTSGSPISALWVRVPSHLEPSAATLAIFGDFVAGGASQPLGQNTMGRSPITQFVLPLSCPPSGSSSRHTCTHSREDFLKAPDTSGVVTGYCSGPPVSRCHQSFGIRRPINAR
jgi:hypothetical protein